LCNDGELGGKNITVRGMTDVIDPHTATRRTPLASMLAGLVVVGIAVGLGVWLWRTKGPLGFLFPAVLFGLGVLSAKYPRIERTIDALFSGYFKVTIWMMIALAPAALTMGVATGIQRSGVLWLQVPAFVAWGALLGLSIWFLTTDARRARLFDSLRHVGGLAPLAYSFNVLVAAIAFFGSLTTVLLANGYIAMDGDPRRAMDFYLWHFLDAIPVLKINETLLWASPPITYHQARVGVLLLIFKIAVIGPVIAAFTGYWARAQPSDS
jgi:hypothetical protein